MKTIEIKGHLRGSLGSKDAKLLRREGQVPCVVYGGGENIHFHADIRELNKLVYTPEVYLVTLNLDGKMVKAVVRDAQYHPVGDQMLHMDLTQIVDGKPVSIQLPVHVNGTAVGVKAGGTMRQSASRLSVRGQVDTLPDSIEIDVTNLKIGGMVKVGDLKVAGVEFMEAANRVVVAVRTSRKVVAEGEEEAAPAAEAPAESEE